MNHPTRYTLLVRKQVEINTDPQRRCYDGGHFSSKMVWTDWAEVYRPATKEDGEASIRTFQSINPNDEYKLLPSENLK
jgi:hypothetical protein